MENNDSEHPSELAHLPTDVVGVIFSHAQIDYWDLASIALVSKEWHIMAFRVEHVDLIPFPRERDRNRYRGLKPSSDILSKLTRLRSFRVTGSASFSERTLNALSKHNNLHSIEFRKASEDVSSSMVRDILKLLPNLRHFALIGCDHIDSRILPPLLECKELRSLILWDNIFVRNQISALPMAQVIAENLTNLERLELNVVDVTTGPCWAAFGSMKNLKYLKIAYTSAGDNLIPEAFCDATELVELEIERSGYFSLPRKGLSKLINLKKLTIRANMQGYDVFGGMNATAVEVPPALVELHLYDCMLNAPVSISALAASIQIVTMRVTGHIDIPALLPFKGLPHLRKLRVARSPFYGKMTEEEEKIIAQLAPVLELAHWI